MDRLGYSLLLRIFELFLLISLYFVVIFVFGQLWLCFLFISLPILMLQYGAIPPPLLQSPLFILIVYLLQYLGIVAYYALFKGFPFSKLRSPFRFISIYFMFQAASFLLLLLVFKDINELFDF